MVTFRHGEDVDKDVPKSDVMVLSPGYGIQNLIKKNFDSGSLCAHLLFALLSNGITQNKIKLKKGISLHLTTQKWIRSMESDMNGLRLNDITILPLGC